MSNLNTVETNLDQALKKFITAMRLFISAELNRKYGDAWERKYVEALSFDQQEFWGKNILEGADPIELIDFGNLTSFAIKQKEFFRQFVGKKCNNLPTYFFEINETRIPKAHYLPINKDNLESAYLNMIKISKMLKMNELEEGIRKLKEGVPMVKKNPVYRKPNELGTRYESARLTFKKEVIEPLSMDDEFTVYVSNDGGSYTMSKRDFYRVFKNVVNSDSYSGKTGNYNYSKTPQKAQEFFKPH